MMIATVMTIDFKPMLACIIEEILIVCTVRFLFTINIGIHGTRRRILYVQLHRSWSGFSGEHACMARCRGKVRILQIIYCYTLFLKGCRLIAAAFFDPLGGGLDLGQFSWIKNWPAGADYQFRSTKTPGAFDPLKGSLNLGQRKWPDSLTYSLAPPNQVTHNPEKEWPGKGGPTD